MGQIFGRQLGRACLLLATLFVSYQSAEAAAPDVAQDADAPGRVSKDWKRLHAADLTVVGNASEHQLRTALKEIEDFRASLVALFPGLKLTSRVATTLVVLKDFNSFRTFQPRDEKGRRNENVDGYFTSTPTMNYMVLGDFGDRDAMLEVVLHEYTHFILHQNFRTLPLWVSEGTAEFYSTFRSNYKDDKSLIGNVPKDRMGEISQRGLLPLDRIVTTEGASKTYRDYGLASLFYAESWAFVHYIQLGNEKRRGQLSAYLRALERGLSEEQAFKAAFGVTYEEMQKELDRYVHQASMHALLFSPSATTTETASAPVNRLTEADAAFLQADLLLQLGATEDAERLLTHALASEPHHTDATIALARVRNAQDKRDEAIATLQAITTSKPDTFSAHLYLASILRAAHRYDDARRTAERAVALDRESSSAWYEWSVSALASGHDKEADDALAHIVEHDSSPVWYWNRTYDAYALGRDDVVVRSAAAYLAAQTEEKGASVYVGYAAALAYMRLGRQQQATALLKTIDDAVPLGSWQSLIARFLQGQFTGEKLLDKAKTDGDRTEGHAYIGALDAVLGKKEEALVHLRWVKEHGLKSYVEYRMATAELDRLEGSKP